MEGSNEAPRLPLQHIASRHVNPVQGNQKSYFLGSDLKKIEELVKETIENPDVVKRHRTRRDRGIKKRKWQTVLGVHGITGAPCYSVTVIYSVQNQEIITAFPTL